MKSTIFLLLVLSGMVVPCQAVKRVTAAQLEQLVTSLHGKPDGDLAYQIGDLELTERLSAERTAGLSRGAPRRKKPAGPDRRSPTHPNSRLPPAEETPGPPPRPMSPPSGESWVWPPTT